MAKFYDTTVTGNLSLLGFLLGYVGNISIIKRDVFSPGSFSPSDNTIGAIVIATGGGGAGGNAYVTDTSASSGGGGGGAGGTAIRYYTYAQLNASTFAVGSGGAVSGTNGNSGGNGGSTVFTPADGSGGVTLTANGGTGGTGTGTGVSGVDVRTGSAGGSGNNGQLNIRGGAGCFGYGSQAINGLLAVGGRGGESFWGGGRFESVLISAGVSDGTLLAGTNYGSGGSGGAALNTATTNAEGSPGEDGTLVFLQFIAGNP